MDRPDKFWKFRPVDDRLRAILERQELWFASPSSFNDPYDCAPVIDSSATSTEVRRHFVNTMAKDFPGIPRAQRIRQVNELAAVHPAFRAGFAGSDVGNAYIKNILDEVIGRTGVLSLGGTGNVVLMWSHYAASHQGVALAFNTDGPLFHEAAPVRYETDRPIVRFFRDQATMIEKALYTKADYWAYEQEWRVLSRNYVGVRLFTPRDLPSIIFGARCPEDDKVRVREWAKAGGLLPAFYQAQFDSKTFGLRVKGVPV